MRRTAVATGLWLAVTAGAAAGAAAPVAHLESAQGSVEARGVAAPEWSPAPPGTAFAARDTVRTAAASRAAILFADGVLVRLNERTVLEFKEPASGVPAAPMRLDAGAAYFLTRSGCGSSAPESFRAESSRSRQAGRHTRSSWFFGFFWL